jgi:hypothetical protein
LTAIVLVLWCCDGTRHQILWTAARGIAGRKECPRQPRSLVDGAILELNNEIIDAAEMIPPGQCRQVVLDLGKGGGNFRSSTSGVRASSDPPRHRDCHCINCIRPPHHRSCRRHRDRLVSSRDGPFHCPRHCCAAQRVRHCQRGPLVVPAVSAVISPPPSSSSPRRPNSPCPVLMTWRPNWQSQGTPFRPGRTVLVNCVCP